MSQVCQVTGKRPMAGNNVSHANRRTRRRFNVNMKNKRIWVEKLNKWVSVRVSARGIKTLDKVGTDALFN